MQKNRDGQASLWKMATTVEKKKKGLNRDLKKSILKTMLWPVVTYGSESLDNKDRREKEIKCI